AGPQVRCPTCASPFGAAPRNLNYSRDSGAGADASPIALPRKASGDGLIPAEIDPMAQTGGRAPSERNSFSVRRSRLVLCPLVAVRLDIHVDEVGRGRGRLEEVPALHPLVSALHFGGGDRRRIDQIEAALAQIVDRELIDLRIELAIVVDEVVQIRALVRIDATHRLPD